MNRKGIVLAGGSGTRLYPLTFSQLQLQLDRYKKQLFGSKSEKRYLALLTPIYDAQRESVLQTTVLAMCEPPIKAAPKKEAKQRGILLARLRQSRRSDLFVCNVARHAQHLREFGP